MTWAGWQICAAWTTSGGLDRPTWDLCIHEALLRVALHLVEALEESPGGSAAGSIWVSSGSLLFALGQASTVMVEGIPEEYQSDDKALFVGHHCPANKEEQLRMIEDSLHSCLYVKLIQTPNHPAKPHELHALMSNKYGVRQVKEYFSRMFANDSIKALDYP